MAPRTIIVAAVSILLSACCPAWAADYAVAPVEVSGGVSEGEGAAFYEGIVAALSKRKDIRVVERKLLAKILDEVDLSIALGPSGSSQQPDKGTKEMLADFLLVPGVCKVEYDFYLSLRKVSVRRGSTSECLVSRTRVTSKFGQCASKWTEGSSTQRCPRSSQRRSCGDSTSRSSLTSTSRVCLWMQGTP